MMDSTIPSELIEIKDRLDKWRQNKKFIREKAPADLRLAVVEMTTRYPKTFLHKVLNVSDRWLRDIANNATAKPKRPREQPNQPEFYQLPAHNSAHNGSAKVPLSHKSTDIRIHIERPDGCHMSITIPSGDSDSIHRFYTDFIRG